MSWNDILRDERFSLLTTAEKRMTADNFFDAKIASDPRWEQLSGTERKETRRNFLATIGQKPDSILGKTYKDLATGFYTGSRELASVPENVIALASTLAPDDVPMVNRDNIMELSDWFHDVVQEKFPVAYTEKNMSSVRRFKDLGNPLAVINTINSNAPTMGVAMGAMVLHPVFGAALMAGMEGGSVARTFQEYEERTGEELPESMTRIAPMLVGAINAALEYAPIDYLLKTPVGRGLKGKITKALISAAFEGGTEAGQELTTMMAELGVVPSEVQNVSDRLKQAFLGGVVLGTAGGAIFGERGQDITSNVYPLALPASKEYLQLQETFLDPVGNVIITPYRPDGYEGIRQLDDGSVIGLLGASPTTLLLPESTQVLKNGRTAEGVLITTPKEWNNLDPKDVINLPEDLQGPYRYKVTPAIVDAYNHFARVRKGIETARQRGFAVQGSVAKENQALTDLATKWIEANPTEENLDGLSNMLALNGHTNYSAYVKAKGKKAGNNALQFQHESGSEIPVTAPQVERLLRPFKTAGLFTTIVMSPTQLRKSTFNPDISLTEDAEVFAAVDPVTGALYLSPKIRMDTIGHEAFEVFFGRLGATDPVIKAGLEMFGGDKEALANAIGEYYAGATFDKNMLSKITRWIHQVMAQMKAKFGLDMTRQDVISVINSRLVEGVDSFAVGENSAQYQERFKQKTPLESAKSFYTYKLNIAEGKAKNPSTRSGERITAEQDVMHFKEILQEIEDGTYEPPMQFQEKQESDMANSINLNHLNLSKAEKNIIRLAMLGHEKRKTSWKEVDKEAAKYLSSIDKIERVLYKAVKGQGLNAGEITALQQVITQSTHGLMELALNPEATSDNLAQAIDSFSNLLEARDTAGHTIGAALGSLKRDLEYVLSKGIAEAQRTLRPDELERLKMINRGDPIQVKRFLESLKAPTFSKYLYDVFYNSILSGPPTHLKNIASNTLWFTFQFPHRALVGIADVAQYGYTGQSREVFVEEILPMLASIPKSFKMGAQYAKQIITTGKSDYSPLTKMDAEVHLSAFEHSPSPALRALAPYINMPTRALRAMDVWSNVIAFEAQISALAYREAKMNPSMLKGKTIDQYIAEVKKAPSRSIMKEAERFARYATFTDHAGQITQQITKARDAIPGGRLVIPFVRTISNILTRGLEMTPGIGIGLEAMNRSKGWSRQTLPEVAAKQFEGAILALILMSMADDDRLIGAVPSNPAERDAFYRQGKMPWSIKIGEKYYSYSGVEPFNTLFSMVAIATDTISKASDDESIAQTFFNTTQNLVDMVIDSSYLDGFSSMLEKRGIERKVKRLPSTLVPYGGLFRSINNALEIMTEGNQKVRSYNTVMSELARTVPWPITESMTKPPAKINAWGREIALPGGVLRQWLPIKWSEGTTDPLETELARINALGVDGIYPGTPYNTLTMGGREYKMSEKFYRDYCMYYGATVKEALDRLIREKSYQGLPDVTKIRLIDRAARKAQDRARSKARQELQRMLQASQRGRR